MLNFNEFQSATSPNKTNNINNVNNAESKNNAPAEASNQIESNNTDNVLVANPSNMVIPKSKFAITMLATGAIGAAIAFGLGRGQMTRLNDSLELLRRQLAQAPSQSTIDGLNGTINDLTQKSEADVKKISELQTRVQELIKKLEERSNLTGDSAQDIEIKAQKYRELLDGVTSIYSDATAPDGTKITKYCYADQWFDFVKKGEPESISTKNPYIENLLDTFRTKGRIEIQQKVKSSSPEDIEKAKVILTDEVAFGKPQGTSLLTDYGNTSNWSDEKIARDILQNFYDGNGHSLDDVGVLIERLSSGKYKIRISGNGVFNNEKLMLLGATSKTKNLEDAGGFGEGAKVCVANMLAKNKTGQVRFRSADWDLIFDSKNKRIRTTLNQTSDILDGNYVEFESDDSAFVEEIIKAIDYFKHSNNPDFQNLTYNGKDFGFRILKPGEKGNFYLTQRFEYGDRQAWNNNLDGLNIIFKRKPDEDLYQEISGHSFNVGRDRSEMRSEDIYELTKCFTQDMTDEEVIDGILSTQCYWDDLGEKSNEGVRSLIKALNEEAKKRKIGINFDDAKICYLDSNANDVVVSSVSNAGYRIIKGKECDFEAVGMSRATNIFKTLSNHTALEPTPAEAKKLKVLEEATSVIQEAFSSTYAQKAKDIFLSLAPEDLQIPKDKVDCYRIQSALAKIKDFNFSPDAFGREDIYSLPKIQDTEKLNTEIRQYLTQKINGLNASNIYDEDNRNALELFTTLIERNSSDNEILKQYTTQIKNLQIIEPEDVKAPRFIFDRKNELNKTTLGEAILHGDYSFDKHYAGHWVDRGYLNEGSFVNLLATWMHEICHKSGGDGTSEFTYKLTDMIESLLAISTKDSDYQTDLLALEKVFNEIQ